MTEMNKKVEVSEGAGLGPRISQEEGLRRLHAYTQQPMYTHDCEACVYLGSSDCDDFWAHQNPHGLTLILRHSAVGEDYSSRTLPPAHWLPYLREGHYAQIVAMAQLTGLIPQGV